ncbi:hypothetical protein IWX78_001284 [Mycetocola sp. CAN_C7]|uniref:hypothetical protein n=1 Tax=Mycetocola sp. CAN_C7 TaxID=2787724 RepID=UPI0018CBA17B
MITPMSTPISPSRSSIASSATLGPAPKASSRIRRTTGLRLVPVTSDLWRATIDDGRILGHIERRDDPAGTTFIAKRLVPAQARFHTLGEFWTIDDAMDCLHSL